MKGAEGTESRALVVNDIKQSFAYLEKAVSNFDPRFTLRVLRGLPALRKRVDGEVIAQIVQDTYPDNEVKQALLKFAGASAGGSGSSTSGGESPVLPEVDIFVHLLIVVWLYHGGRSGEFQELVQITVRRLREYNRRSLDYLGAKVWFYYSLSVEGSAKFEEIRPELLSALRTATLRRDVETQASLITLLLRNYLSTNKVSQAANLVSKTNFPELASNALAARYYYYLARINAIQLNYSAAYERVTSAIRKAPQTSQTVGFLQAAHKLSIVVEMLMGDIPERTVFKQPSLEKSLEPYFDVARAVRAGDITQFTETIRHHAGALRRDGTYSLVLRLRQNVIKTGIRIMSLTYSRISLKDICLRLHLDSEESAEYIVSKAIRDGVIDASIDHERGFMQSNEVVDVYSTAEPQDTFHERIKFCISLHNDSVKSMRYLMNEHRKDLKTAEEAREREKELVSEIQDTTDFDDDEGDFDL